MRQFTRKAAIMVLTVAVIAGCHKDDNNNGGSTKTQLLTSGSWKLTSEYFDVALDVNGDGRAENEVINVLPSCFTDNLISFKGDGTVTRDEGASKCDPSDPQLIETTNWKFSDNETKIMIGDPGYEDVGQLVELSATVLKIKLGDPGSGITLTFAH
ncbi:lipocalin-like domain-containing protein [Pinibacter aurantiacus]|uniref:Lipocalin family protein n=1 Tax=Pinibacter aurantiacus TaxID=2851599 RepID=A0A9E2S9D7_9BACT|nr:lipocalin family protein [Pinibacter aurantiacus]MBV4357074.1 lipocalin family protein [Pinibacter aurantiacus]